MARTGYFQPKAYISLLIFESHFLVLCSLLFLIIIIMPIAKLFQFPQSWLETWAIQANIKSQFPDQTPWKKEKKIKKNSKSTKSPKKSLEL